MLNYVGKKKTITILFVYSIKYIMKINFSKWFLAVKLFDIFFFILWRKNFGNKVKPIKEDESIIFYCQSLFYIGKE